MVRVDPTCRAAPRERVPGPHSGASWHLCIEGGPLGAQEPPPPALPSTCRASLCSPFTTQAPIVGAPGAGAPLPTPSPGMRVFLRETAFLC